jgi:hypothetical protein
MAPDYPEISLLLPVLEWLLSLNVRIGDCRYL